MEKESAPPNTYTAVPMQSINPDVNLVSMQYHMHPQQDQQPNAMPMIVAVHPQNGQPPPSFEQVAQFQPQQDYIMPNYYVPDIVPDGTILTPSTCQPLDHPTNSVCQTGKDLNISSFDANLDSDEKELWRFFMSHLEAPKQFIQIHGWHTEQRTRTVRRDRRTQTETYTVTVTDFQFQLDMSHYISPGWSRIMSVPKKDEPVLSFERTLKEYCMSKSILKQIKMKKQCIWDYAQVTKSIEFAIRNMGYLKQLSITYFNMGNSVEVHSSNAFSRTCENKCFWTCMKVSCLWIIAWPIYYFINDKTSNDIVCDYPVMISPQDFYSRNFYLIQQNCASRNTSNSVIPAM